MSLCGWLGGQISAGNAGVAYQVLGLERRTLGVVLGHCLDHREWGQAQAIARALTMYWEARGLYEEAAAWTGRVQAATEQPGGAPPPLDTPAGSLWLFITGSQANRQRAAGRPDQAATTHQQILDMLGARPPTRQRQADIAAACHNLGDCAQDRGRLDEAEDWYRRSLTIEEDLGNRPGTALTYAQLGLLAEETGQPLLALERNIRCVLMFDEFPHPMSGTGPTALVRLTRQLGVPALERAWRQITGQTLPQTVRDYITSPTPGAGDHR